MSDADFVLALAVFAALGSLFGFLLPHGGELPVRTWPFRSTEQTTRFTRWALLVVAFAALVTWLSMRR